MADMIVTKVINAKKFDLSKYKREFKKVADKAANDILLDFELTTGTWEHEVKFKKIVAVGPESVDVLVGTDDEIYGYVNNGTKEHDIPKAGSGKGPLAFNWAGPGSYKAKTKPGSLVSFYSSGAGGNPVVFKKIHHPGTKARNFAKGIQKKWGKLYWGRMRNVMVRLAKQSSKGAA